MSLLYSSLKIATEVYVSLNNEIEKVSWYLNAYSQGIINNNGIKD